MTNFLMSLSPRSASALQLGALSLLSAFLLFQVQPVISKFILPWFGGSPGVWSTCLLCFQVLLCAGYAYAHTLRRLSRKWQWSVHGTLVLAAVCTLPIAPGPQWKPTGETDPVRGILAILLANVALPYFVLSSTSPLVQVWFGRLGEGRAPWRLYALSNLGSLAALLSYPFFVEPRWDVMQQAWLWSGGFVLFALLSLWSAHRDWKLGGENQPDDRAPDIKPLWSRRLLWVLLPAVASVLLLATTNHLCQDVAVIPFLWVLPLSLYLLTFIICFEHERWYARAAWALPSMVVLLAAGTHESLVEQDWWHWDLAPNFQAEIALVCGAMFLGCMICHGELTRLKPGARHLTEFYLFMSAGGALGGLFVSLAAPRLFTTYREWPYGLFVAFAISSAALTREVWSMRGRWSRRFGLAGAVALSTALGIWFAMHLTPEEAEPIAITRNFYGVISVVEEFDDHGTGSRTLYHGDIVHGYQYLSVQRRNEPHGYYGGATGIGRVLRALRGRADAHVGVVGMGAGTVAAYGKKGQRFRFYDINPAIVRLARTHFHFLEDMEQRGGTVEVAMGDARQSLEREKSRRFDVLLLDAFSGDAVPVHLLTREAFEIYLRHMKPEGVIAVHVSNRYIALAPVVTRVAESLGMRTTRVITEFHGLDEASDYVLVTNSQATLNANPPDVPDVKEPVVPTLWTDRRHNLFEILL